MTTTTQTTTDTATHPFERAGLGVGPFKYVGGYEAKFQAVPGDPNCPIQPGTSCDYCGQGIYFACRIQDSRGHVFKVGRDCALKTGDRKIVPAIRAQKNKVARARAHKRADEQIAEARAALARPEVVAALRAQPHPMPSWGGTMLDRVEWLLTYAGRKGKVDAAKIIASAVAGSAG